MEEPSSLIQACRLWFPIFTICASLSIHPVESRSQLIGDVCARTRFIDYCKHALMSDPSSRGANLHQLGDISIGLTLSSAQRSVEKADQLIGRTRDIVLAGKLRKCKEAYNSAAGQMRQARQMWGSGNVGGTRNAAFASIQMVFACRDALGGSERELSGNNRDIEYLSHIVLVIVDFK
uniref:Pectinesterase inhibitor domain-containing protein n=1 Tax=Kalanchoe fedtschenkoi TaxID=63787 RepID=A0A7N0TSN2_KALFE